MTNYSETLLKHSAFKAIQKIIYESRTSFYASNALFVPEGTSDSEAEKTECERKLNDPTTPTTDSLGKNQFR